MQPLQSLRRLVYSLPIGNSASNDPLRASKQDLFVPAAGEPRDGSSGRVPAAAPATRRTRSLVPFPSTSKRAADPETEALLRERTASFDVESQQDDRRKSLARQQEDPSPVNGALCLLGVAFLWGTYSPALRYVYSLDGPPSPEVLTAVRGLIQAAGLAVVSLGSSRASLMRVTSKSQMQHDGTAYGMSRRWQAGLELGLWNFIATWLQATGLEATSATKGAFLIQATSLLTPLLAVVNGERLSKWVWAGCVLALLSTCLIIVDSHDDTLQQGASAFITTGDAAVLGAAFFYSVATVRLSHHARLVPSMALATAKSWVLAGIAAAALLVTVGSQESGKGVSLLWPGAGNTLAWLLIVWSALGPGALAAFLQTLGQSSVSAARAQIFYSSTPIWSALLGLTLLHEDQLGTLGWIGGLGLLSSSLLANR